MQPLQVGSITINPTAGPAQLLIQGPMLDNTPNAPGLTMGYAEAAPLPNQWDPLPLSVGIFRLNRPTGLYQWQFSGAADRLAMELKNDHRLVLHSSDPADHVLMAGQDPDTNAIELRPGASGGVFFNGESVLRQGAFTLAGGSVQMPPGTNTFNFPPDWYSDGLIAAGHSTLAIGVGSVALGDSAQAWFRNSIAIGDHAYANTGGIAFGVNAYSAGGTAIGATAFEAPPTFVYILRHE